MTTWRLPVINRSDKPRSHHGLTIYNECGECTECCIHMPCAEPDLTKPAGVACEHLTKSGCSMWQKAGFPKLCQNFFCAWRTDKYMARREEWRPDRVGVIVTFNGDVMNLWETRQGALQSEDVKAIRERHRGKFIITKLMPYGSLNNLIPTGKTPDGRHATSERRDPSIYTSHIPTGPGEITVVKHKGSARDGAMGHAGQFFRDHLDRQECRIDVGDEVETITREDFDKFKRRLLCVTEVGPSVPA